MQYPKAVQAAIQQHLQEPFQSEIEQKAYWLETGTKLIHSAPPKDLTPEYSEPLPEGYSISLVITSDAGEGTYYVTKPLTLGGGCND